MIQVTVTLYEIVYKELQSFSFFLPQMKNETIHFFYVPLEIWSLLWMLLAWIEDIFFSYISQTDSKICTHNTLKVNIEAEFADFLFRKWWPNKEKRTVVWNVFSNQYTIRIHVCAAFVNGNGKFIRIESFLCPFYQVNSSKSILLSKH